MYIIKLFNESVTADSIELNDRNQVIVHLCLLFSVSYFTLDHQDLASMF